MQCSRKDTCLNHGKKCYECGAMSDVFNHYPCYTNKIDQTDKLMRLINEIPELLNNANRFPWKKARLVEYLIENGVRVEET